MPTAGRDPLASLDVVLPAFNEAANLPGLLAQLRQVHGEDAIRELDETPYHFHYPVEAFPRKVVSHNFDKQPQVEGVLQGVKGQYLALLGDVLGKVVTAKRYLDTMDAQAPYARAAGRRLEDMAWNGAAASFAPSPSLSRCLANSA